LIRLATEGATANGQAEETETHEKRQVRLGDRRSDIVKAVVARAAGGTEIVERDRGEAEGVKKSRERLTPCSRAASAGAPQWHRKLTLAQFGIVSDHAGR